ncbi:MULTISPECIES: CAAX protease [unclassified Nodularia (in: cyanobacteria)]|uniref:CAAX protease n=1 Tax=unclassified Nodularia (in: cyanobacteria) TaxID=2656917 RepID=UPI0018817C18|nr:MULTISPECIES: CAAX protease [unclassified Nodularia (in: cyanobacteria)]MBE9200497.1 CAAX protease [Nodularia sp. LEGE 06071]MCC2691205.1 CAAX protease [Nodularia sp. LEGE 04288]
MTSTVMDRVWEILGWVFVLNGEAFRKVTTLPRGLILAIAVVLLAQLSLAIGQSIILFLNRVQPIRFIWSLLVSTILSLFEFLFLVFSTWLICLLPWSIHIPFTTLLTVLGLGYAPLLFSFLGALPYLGLPLLRILSIWNLLAMVVGFDAVANIGAGFSFGYVAFGWFVKEMLEKTIGQPIAQLGKIIADRVAGVNLSANREELAATRGSALGTVPFPLVGTFQTTLPKKQHLIQTSGHRSHSQTLQAVTLSPTPSATVTLTPRTHGTGSFVHLTHQANSIAQPIHLLLSLLGLFVLFFIVGILLRPIRSGVFGWYEALPTFSRLIFDLGWIGVIALVFSGLLAPFETLGWWAGWFGEQVDKTQITSTLADSQQPSQFSRYLIYLDGVGQSGEEYTPDVEDFLTVLTASLPQDIKLVRGLMMYSVLNKPLHEDRPLAFLWKLADKLRWDNPTALLGILVNLRNVLIVAVSADQRYGPIYNRGIAQVLYNGLVAQDYQLGSATPITLLGYSGGGQMAVASAPYLRQALRAPIDVVSLGGVMSANNNFLQIEHLYHLIGDQDVVQRLGLIMFPGRWKILPLSYWNRAERKGKISILSVGSVGHQVPGGYMDPEEFLPNGRSNLQQTVETILRILTGNLLQAGQNFPVKLSNYAHYKQAAFNDPAYYPLNQTVNLHEYQAIAPWMGRLILPHREARQIIKGVLFEVHHTPANYEHLVGKIVKLRWVDTPFVKYLKQAATHDVHFSADADYSSKYDGLIHPERLNHWQQVDPLESLAGSHPTDDIVVSLNEPVEVEESGSESLETWTSSDAATTLSYFPISLRIHSQPVQITGRFYALVKFVQPIPYTDQFRVVHFNSQTREFNGSEEVIRLPEVVMAATQDSSPSTTRDLEKSALNETGWYIYGAKDTQGRFVVQSLQPRDLFRLQPGEVVFGKKPSYRYIRNRSWADIKAQKGRISSVLCTAQKHSSSPAIHNAINDWQEGDRALLIHVYGGIGGKKAEPGASTPIYFGHFALGLAQVIREPLSDELRFDLRYHQVYTHNTDGLIAGTLHWSRYMGDRQFGWLGNRPVCDLLIKHDALSGYYNLASGQLSPLDSVMLQLEVMTARYRIGDGTGGTYVGLVNNCTQDSNQALFTSLNQMQRQVRANVDYLHRWSEHHPEQEQRFKELLQLGKKLKLELQPIGGSQSNWEQNDYDLGSTLEDEPIRNLIMGLGSWRTILPRLASDTLVKIFLDHGATVWVLRTNQIGGYDPDIEPIAPITL